VFVAVQAQADVSHAVMTNFATGANLGRSLAGDAFGVPLRPRATAGSGTPPSVAEFCEGLPQPVLAGRDLKMPLDHWADSAGASRRTLERLFVSETGLTFVQWRQHALMHLAIGRLVGGASISQVCLDLDILSTSAFHRMFRQVFETTPARYLKELNMVD
jgi:AraC-like DNA-binding protein